MGKINVILCTNLQNKREHKLDFKFDNYHLLSLYEEVKIGGNPTNVYKWGDYLYKFNDVNRPITLFGEKYQYVSLKQVGYVFELYKKENGSEEFKFMYNSKSYTSYHECFEDMKKDCFFEISLYNKYAKEEECEEITRFRISFVNNNEIILYHHNGLITKYILKEWK